MKKKVKSRNNKIEERPQAAPILEDFEEEEIGSPKRARHKGRSREWMELEVPLSPNELKKRKEKALELSIEIEGINAQLKKMSAGFMKQRREKRKELFAHYKACEEKKETKRVLTDCLIQENGEVHCYYDGMCLKVITLAELKGMKEARVHDAQTELFGKGDRAAAAKR